MYSIHKSLLLTFVYC